MPYINEDVRKEFEPYIALPPYPVSIGALNYIVTRLVDKYIETHKESYETYNAVIGVLECAKLELYRRQVALYEDKKKEENGDVYNQRQ